MQVEEEEWIIHTLKEYERRQCISKVLSVDCKKAIPKGNNYASDMKRLTLKMVLKSGEIVTRSLILKAMPLIGERRILVKEGGLYARETKMFKEIFPAMEKLRQRSQQGVERLTPLCYGVMSGHQGYLLEDLTVSGFKMVDRQKALDFQHGELVMNALAEFHACGKILIENGDIALSDIMGNVYLNKPEIMEAFISTSIGALINTIQEDWKGEWLMYVDKLHELKASGCKLFIDAFHLRDSDFNSLTHGDCWTANMMFRYDNQCKPQGFRFLDFQISNYNSVANDLQYFFNASLNIEALRQKKELLKIYYNKLINSLELYGYSGVMPKFEDILEGYNAARWLGLVAAFVFRPLMMQPDETVHDDLEEWTKDVFGNNAKHKINLNSDTAREMLQYLLKTAREDGLL